jgi:CRP-like cAMP-binding protein
MFGSSVLKKYSLFGGIPEEQIDKIIPRMLQETYNAGDTILVEGSPNDKIHFLVEGTVAVIKGDLLLCELTEGNTFGEMEVLDVMPSTATTKALTNVTVMTMSNRALREIYHEDIKSFALLLMNLARDLSRRIRYANKKVVCGEDAAGIFYNGTGL